MFKKLKDIEQDLHVLRETGNPKGNMTGFKCIDDLYTIKMGAYTIILAEPHHGKSEFGFEICLNENRKYGTKTMVYSPETGSVADIFAELIHKHTGRPIHKSLPNHLGDRELESAKNHIDHCFNIVNSDEKGFSYEEIMKMCTDEDLIFIDPNNEVVQTFLAAYGSRQDLYIEDIAAEIRRWNRKKNKHTIITMHPARQQAIVDKSSGNTYYPPPKARMAAGGEAWYRKAMGWINLWRPPAFINDEFGYPYPENAVIGIVEKAKPKGVGKRGQFVLYFDWKANRYYEKIDGMDMYAFGHEDNKSYLQPSINFYETDREEPVF